MLGRDFIPGASPRPRVSLGGPRAFANDRAAVLRRAQEDRRMREELRRHDASAIRIQAWRRGIVARRRLRAELEAVFGTEGGVARRMMIVLRIYHMQNCQMDASLAGMIPHVAQALLAPSVFRNGSPAFLDGYCDDTQQWSWMGGRFLALCTQASCTIPDSDGLLVPLLLSWTDPALAIPSQATLYHSLIASGFYRHVAALFQSDLGFSLPMRGVLKRVLAAVKASPTAVISLLQSIFTLQPNMLKRAGVFRDSAEWPLQDMIKSLAPPIDDATVAPPLLPGVARWVHELLNIEQLRLLANIIRVMRLQLAGFSHNAALVYCNVIRVLIQALPDDAFRENLDPDTAFAASNLAAEEESLQANGSESRTPLALREEPDTAASLRLFFDPVHITGLFGRIRTEPRPGDERNYFDAVVLLCVIAIQKWASNRDGILNALSVHVSKQLVPLLWNRMEASSVWTILSTSGFRSSYLEDGNYASFWATFLLLSDIYARILITMGDDEFHNTDKNPLNLNQVQRLSYILKDVVFNLQWNGDSSGSEGGIFGPGTLEHMRLSFTMLFQYLHARESRRPYAGVDHWIIHRPELEINTFADVIAEFEEEDGDDQQATADQAPHRLFMTSQRLHRKRIAPRLAILREIPFVMPFESRVRLFRALVHHDREKSGNRSFYGFSTRRARIRRGHAFQDGFSQLNAYGANLKDAVQIEFIDRFGLPELGIDGGGVFKEFVNDLVLEAFDPNRGLFASNTSQMLYPSPYRDATRKAQLQFYEFVGRIIGKALYDGILVDVHFAHFFLAKWLGRPSFLDDLPSRDQELYNGLVFLKNYNGNVEDLALTFTVNDYELGVQRTTELVSGGSNINVTKENRIRYIFMVAYYRLNSQIQKQCRSFLSGLSDIIDPRWLQLFNQNELQALISGTSQPVDLDDLQRNTEYQSESDAQDPIVQRFWRVISNFDDEHRRKLLKFATSCPRAPLLGFTQLTPKFAIQLTADGLEDRLPTASTCVNLLKLPRYASDEVMREYANDMSGYLAD